MAVCAESELGGDPTVGERVDAEGVAWTSHVVRPSLNLYDAYCPTWNSRQHHFTTYADIKPKGTLSVFVGMVIESSRWILTLSESGSPNTQSGKHGDQLYTDSPVYQ